MEVLLDGQLHTFHVSDGRKYLRDVGQQENNFTAIRCTSIHSRIIR
jgi:hypothetical protein